MILDSNVLIYAIQPSYEWLENFLVAHLDELHVSSISRLEVQGFHKLTPLENDRFTLFFNAIHNISISDEIITEAIRLRQQRRRSLGDAIIAATALVYKQPILTHNTADFLTVEGIEVIELLAIKGVQE